jgi:hypothetical protein
MFVSILQRFVCRVIQLGGEPLQSRADQNTRNIESGGQFSAGKRQIRQTNQEIWQQEGLNRTAVVWPGSRLRALKVAPVRLSRGDTL